MTPLGWAELVAWMQEQSAAGALDVEVVWDHFRTLAATSEQAGLSELAGRFHAAPAQDRLALAGTVAGMLGPVEWPVAWRGPRERLGRALEDLGTEMYNYSAGPPALDNKAPILLLGAVCGGASRLLRTPCRRDELSVLALQCNMVAGSFASLAGHSFDSSILRAVVAFGAYAEAARALNAACGVVLLTNLDWNAQKGPA